MTRLNRLLVVTPDPATFPPFTSKNPHSPRVSFSQDGLHAAMRAIEDRPDLILWDAAIDEPDPLTVLASLRRDHRTASIAMIVIVNAIDRAFVRRMRQGRLPIVRMATLAQATPLHDGLIQFGLGAGRFGRASLIH